MGAGASSTTNSANMAANPLQNTITPTVPIAMPKFGSSSGGDIYSGVLPAFHLSAPPIPELSLAEPITLDVRQDDDFVSISLQGAQDIFFNCCDANGCISKDDVWEYYHLCMMDLRFKKKVLHPQMSNDFATEIVVILNRDVKFQASTLISWSAVRPVLAEIYKVMDTQDKSKLFTIDAIPDDGYSRGALY